MVIIIDKNTKQVINNQGGNVLYPDGNIPYLELLENEEAVKIHDNSELANKINSALSYELVFDENGIVVDANVTKTLAQYKQEQESSNEYLIQQIKNELATLDSVVPRLLEDIIEQGNFTIHQSKIDIINQKKQLRIQLSTLQG